MTSLKYILTIRALKFLILFPVKKSSYESKLFLSWTMVNLCRVLHVTQLLAIAEDRAVGSTFLMTQCLQKAHS